MGNMWLLSVNPYRVRMEISTLMWLSTATGQLLTNFFPCYYQQVILASNKYQLVVAGKERHDFPYLLS